MKNVFRTVLLAGLAAAGLSAAETTSDAASKTAAPDSAAYPLATCVVSGQKLGGMGDPYDYVYKQAGKPDRTVRFCCEHCVPKFEKDPAKYLSKLDEAATAKKKS